MRRLSAADRSENSNAMTFAASRSAHRAAETLSLISREAIQLHGAIGYTDDCDVGVFVNRGIAVAARYGRAANHLTRLANLQSATQKSDTATGDTSGAASDMTPANNDWNALDNDTFRAVARQWHKETYPEELKNLNRRVRWHQCQHWYKKLYQRGFAAPGWPAEHGGMGLAPDKLLILLKSANNWASHEHPTRALLWSVRY